MLPRKGGTLMMPVNTVIQATGRFRMWSVYINHTNYLSWYNNEAPSDIILRKIQSSLGVLK